MISCCLYSKTGTGFGGFEHAVGLFLGNPGGRRVGSAFLLKGKTVWCGVQIHRSAKNHQVHAERSGRPLPGSSLVVYPGAVRYAADEKITMLPLAEVAGLPADIAK